jgi:hypothetical protein
MAAGKRMFAGAALHLCMPGTQQSILFLLQVTTAMLAMPNQISSGNPIK